MEVLKIFCLFTAIFWTIVNISKTCAKNSIPSMNFLLQSIGIAGFIYLQWLI